MKPYRTTHGVKTPHPNYKNLARLKRKFRPTNHGHKVWPSSWLLIDYLRKSQAVSGRRVMDLACGWGLAGIYCAKMQNACVTCVDIDDAVQPFVELMADLNGVKVDFLNLEISKIRKNELRRFDVIIGADLCFCDTLIDPLTKLVFRAKAAGVRQILISDPGRWPFDDLSEHLIRKTGAVVLDWEAQKPQPATGKILTIAF
jgi:predicted nicotinamide N-methyase